MSAKTLLPYFTGVMRWYPVEGYDPEAMDGWRATLQRRRIRVLCVIYCWWINGGWLTPSGAVRQQLARRRGWEESTPLFFIAPASHHANIGQTHQRCVITANTAKY